MYNIDVIFIPSSNLKNIQIIPLKSVQNPSLANQRFSDISEPNRQLSRLIPLRSSAVFQLLLWSEQILLHI